jgi:hypothetical protein
VQISRLPLAAFVASCLSASLSSASAPRGSLLLPPPGREVQYRYSEMTADGEHITVRAATFSVKTHADGRIDVTVAMKNQEPSTIAMRVDDSGALEAVSLPTIPSGNGHAGRNLTEERAALQTILARLSLAARLGASASFPIRLDVPHTSSPVHATLFSTPAGADGFKADAVGSTSMRQPHRRRSLLAIGAGVLVAAFSGRIGRAAGVLVATAGGAIGAHFGSARPEPVDVSLHLDGRETSGRLAQLSADQEVIVYTKRDKKTESDRWSLTAQ